MCDAFDFHFVSRLRCFRLFFRWIGSALGALDIAAQFYELPVV